MEEMDPLDFLSQEELSRFFHCKKTEISCMKDPYTFLNQLRDHDLVPEHLYRKVIKIKCESKRQDGVYEILNWLEKERGECVKLFWTCVFKDHILQKYSVLHLLRDSLMDGSFRFYMERHDAKEKSKNKEGSIQSGEDKANGKKRKKRSEETEEREKAGPSSFSTRSQKIPAKKPTFNPPLKKGETAAIWMLDLHKTHLPVTCGDKKGTLYRDKLARKGKSIQSQGQWFTAGEFVRFAGKGNGRRWKQRILCQNTPLQRLIKEGHLQCPTRSSNKKKIQFPDISLEDSSSESVSSVDTEGSRDLDEEETLDEEEEDDDDDDDDDDDEDDQYCALPVSCGSVSGTLYRSRFAGPRSKSIRTEEHWFSPEEFVMQELSHRERHWEEDILCQGKTLNHLLKKRILRVHPLQCPCELCSPDSKMEQDNDDVCFICNSAGNLVCCDDCPRAFHRHCHLPVLQDSTLGSNWLCTFCVLKTNERLWIPMTQEGALKSLVSGNILRCEFLLLCLYKEDALCVFTQDPTATVPRYTKVISKPMWLDQVTKKLHNKEYRTVSEFVGDVRLIFQNCRIFNKDNQFGKMGARLSEIFEREFRTAFKIQ